MHSLGHVESMNETVVNVAADEAFNFWELGFCLIELAPLKAHAQQGVNGVGLGIGDQGLGHLVQLAGAHDPLLAFRPGGQSHADIGGARRSA